MALLITDFWSKWVDRKIFPEVNTNVVYIKMVLLVKNITIYLNVCNFCGGFCVGFVFLFVRLFGWFLFETKDAGAYLNITI